MESGPEYFFGEHSSSGSALLFKNAVRRSVALFLDYDGTLVPIQKNPAQCLLDEATREKLSTLARLPRCYVMILSGRALSDIKERIGIEGIYYGGNHGLDITGPGMSCTHPKALQARPFLATAARRLKHRIRGINGAWVEDKEFGVSLHFREASRADTRRVRSICYEVVLGLPDSSMITIMKGKKVLELVPEVVWNKGATALWMLQHFVEQCLPVCIGDDVTDETAFKALGRRGITIRVGGSKKTFARYYLKSHREIPRLFEELLKHFSGGTPLR